MRPHLNGEWHAAETGEPHEDGKGEVDEGAREEGLYTAQTAARVLDKGQVSGRVGGEEAHEADGEGQQHADFDELWRCLGATTRVLDDGRHVHDQRNQCVQNVDVAV